MNQYERGYYTGKLAKILSLYANLPSAVECPDEFQGYCDGYMKRKYNEPECKVIMGNVLNSLTLITE